MVARLLGQTSDDAEATDREHVGQTIAQAGGSVGMVGLEPGGDRAGAGQPVAGSVLVERPGQSCQSPVDPPGQLLGQIGCDVAPLEKRAGAGA